MACAPAESAVIERFFSASRLLDRTQLSRVSSTIFDPREQGTVLSFEILEVHATSADSKDVRVRAVVRTPRGETTTKSIAVVLRRDDDRWLVAAFSDVTDAPASPSTPRN